MAKANRAALLDGDDVAGNTPKAPPQDPTVWDRAGEDAKRERRGEPPLTDDEWNTLRADKDGVVPDEPAAAPAKPARAKKTDAATKAAADRAEAAHEAKKAGKKVAVGDVPPAEPKKRGRKAAEPKEEEEPKERDAVRRARGGNSVGIAGGRILSFVERVENLEEEVKSAQTDIKEVFMEAKGEGFDTKIIKRIIKVRKMDKDQKDEEDSLFDLYMNAIDNAVEAGEGVD